MGRALPLGRHVRALGRALREGRSLPLTAFARVAARDAADVGHFGAGVPEAHLKAAVEWLVRAHDHGGKSGGVSYGYSLLGGFRPPYIETTGYIAVTFFRLSRLFDDPALYERARRMVEWLVDVQNPNGSFSNPAYDETGSGIVFDTGQDLFGLLRANRETGEQRFLDAALRAGEWLVTEAIDDRGRFTRHTHLGVPHVYNTRVAWALLALDRVASDGRYLRVAKANLDYALEEQRENGFFESCAFEPSSAPFTHTIAYAIRGLYESAELSNDERYRRAAVRAANAMLAHVDPSGFIPGQITVEGEPAARYCCLTGNAQMAIVWAKLHRALGDARYREAAVAALRFVMRTQDRDTSDADVRGAIKGSHPIWGAYSPLTYPNWATKFFVDALIECRPWL